MLSKRLSNNHSSHSSYFSPGLSAYLPACLSLWSSLQALDLPTFLRGLKIAPLAKLAKKLQKKRKSASYRLILKIWIPTTTSQLRVVQFGAIRCKSTNSGCQSTQTCLIIRVRAKKTRDPRTSKPMIGGSRRRQQQQRRLVRPPPWIAEETNLPPWMEWKGRWLKVIEGRPGNSSTSRKWPDALGFFYVRMWTARFPWPPETCTLGRLNAKGRPEFEGRLRPRRDYFNRISLRLYGCIVITRPTKTTTTTTMHFICSHGDEYHPSVASDPSLWEDGGGPPSSWKVDMLNSVTYLKP